VLDAAEQHDAATQIVELGSIEPVERPFELRDAEAAPALHESPAAGGRHDDGSAPVVWMRTPARKPSPFESLHDAGHGGRSHLLRGRE
jgi:hypothetical protein